MKKRIVLGLILLVLFLLDMILVINHATLGFDWFVYNAIPHTKYLTSIMKVLTLLGEDFTIVAISIIALFRIRKKDRAVFVPASAILISLINVILKFIIRRPRPDGIALIVEGGYSFPSGHSVTAIVFYGFIIYMISKTTIPDSLKKCLSVLLCLIIITIGISRIYLGVHYASDVLGGFLLGGAFLVAFTSIYENYIKK